MRMQMPSGGGGGARSFLEERLDRRKRMLRMVVRKFGDVQSYARLRRGGGLQA